MLCINCLTNRVNQINFLMDCVKFNCQHNSTLVHVYQIFFLYGELPLFPRMCIVEYFAPVIGNKIPIDTGSGTLKQACILYMYNCMYCNVEVQMTNVIAV